MAPMVSVAASGTQWLPPPSLLHSKGRSTSQLASSHGSSAEDYSRGQVSTQQQRCRGTVARCLGQGTLSLGAGARRIGTPSLNTRLRSTCHIGGARLGGMLSRTGEWSHPVGSSSRGGQRKVPSVGAWLSTGGESSTGRGVRITETDKLDAGVRERVLAAVEKLGGRVTIGDAAAAAGVNIKDTDRALNALAADSNGFLEVSDEGDVLYVFPKDVRSALAQKSLRVRFAPLVKKAQDVGSYLVRVSFGTALLVSIAVVYTAIAVLLSSSNRDNDRGDRGGGFRPSLFFNVSDMFWYWDPYYYERRRMYQMQNQEMSFLESVFSFVFGDGDPNEGMDEARWRVVGELISKKGGVVAAQEVAPFLDIPKDYQENESYMLPVLLRFDGMPEVDSQGNILYKFPSLQRTAQDWTGRPKVLVGDAAVGASSALSDLMQGAARGGQQEQAPYSAWSASAAQRQRVQPNPGPGSNLLYFARNLWEFSGAPSVKQALAAGLGVFNLVGVAYLSYLVQDPMLVRQAGSEFVRNVVALLPWLQVYAAAFFAIPAVRWLTQRSKNERILEENQRREDSALLLAQPPAQLRRKILNAREQAEKVVLDQERVIYSTAKDVADQSLEEREWERKFGKSKEQSRLEEWR